MEFHEAVDTLYGLDRMRPEMGTETTASLLGHLGDPHADLTAVQVAGSNGKGSTVAMLDRILREHGLTVGRYVSPDLNDIRERVTVDGQKITKDALATFVEQAWPHIDSMDATNEAPTFFETLTAMALWYFDRTDVDVAILEVGIGGRYDATSVVEPAAAAVTSVSLEHTSVLGDTVEEIALDKCQVAPDGAPLVTGTTDTALETIRGETDVVTVGVAGEESTDDGIHSDVVVAETGMTSPTEAGVQLEGGDWRVETRSPLLGAHQALNAGIAATLARQVDDVDDGTIARGIRNVHWPGRFEIVGTHPLVVLDGAHNPAACETVTALLERFEYEECTLVFGAMSDKDHAAMSRALPAADTVLLAEPNIYRAEDTEALQTVFERERGTETDIQRCQSVHDAIRQALAGARGDDCVLVAGSLYLVAEARNWWTRTPVSARTDTSPRARATLHNADVPSSVRRAGAGELVHRTVHVRVQRDLATDLEDRLRALGGSVALSGVEKTGKPVDVVLSGTLEQFRGLIEDLRGRSGEARRLVDHLQTVLEIEPSSTDTPWGDGTAVMGILNVTPDSFHDGGEYDRIDAAVERAHEMVEHGASIVDIGGESTRPGAVPVTADIERERVVPVIEALEDLDALLSVDTRKPGVAEAAIDAGAGMVNDVTGLEDARMRQVVADHDVPVVLMHSLSAPVDPDRTPAYSDVVTDVLEDLTERVLLAERAGIDRSRIVVDPGLGFGKTATQSFELVDRVEEFRGLGTPLMIGHSRKSMFASITEDSADRLAPTVATTALAAERGVDVVRVHDVAPNAAAVRAAERTLDTHEER